MFWLFTNNNNHHIGVWVNNEDKDSFVKFDKHLFYQIYKNDTITKVEYKLDTTTCDIKYLSENKQGEFIKLFDGVGTCFEITNLNDSILAYRHTITGKLHVFKKLKYK